MTTMIFDDATKLSKINFCDSYSTTINSLMELETILSEEYEEIPKDICIFGIPQNTGISIVSGGSIVACIKHPKFILNSICLKTKEIEFYGKQTINQIESSMGDVLGIKNASIMAREVIENINTIGYNAVIQKYGFGSVGLELEFCVFDNHGNPYRIPSEEQCEVMNNLVEIALPPSYSIKSTALQIAEAILNEKINRPNTISPNFSFSILSKPHELKMNDGKLSHYVIAVTQRMRNKVISLKKDSPEESFWENLASNFGFHSYKNLEDSCEIIAHLAICASHMNFGLRTSMINGSYRIGMEECIVCGDIIQSNFGTLLEWMTYSTPLAYGIKIGVNIDGQMKYPRDMRAIAKLLSRSCYPSHFLYSTENYNKIAKKNIEKGIADRLDRAATSLYHEDIDKEIVCSHGRVRFRVTGGNGSKKFGIPLGRIEFVGGGETPDLIALLARNSLMTLMCIAAYEALSYENHPSTYFLNRFPNICRDDKCKELGYEYNFEGISSPIVMNLINEGFSFIDYMKDKYHHEDIQYLCALAKHGLDKLIVKTEAHDFNEFINNPKGNIVDVINNMIENGYTPLQIASSANDYEKKLSEMIIENNGNILNMIG